jgi:hypothetical protein
VNGKLQCKRGKMEVQQPLSKPCWMPAIGQPNKKKVFKMKKLIDKHYKGFEGEPEIQFATVSESGDKVILSLWVGFFDSILNLIKPTETGWTGLAYYYHMDEGWYDESPWKIEDVGSTISELKGIAVNNLDNQAKAAYDDILKLLKESQIKNDTVWIYYD